VNKSTTESVGVFAHHYPRVAAVITSQAGSQSDAMTAAWHMPLSYSPPLFAVSISPKRFTYNLITSSHEFGINFMPIEQAETVAAIGGSSGADLDKMRIFHMSSDKPVKTGVPILRTAYAAYECKLADDRIYGDHRLLIGEIVAVHWCKELFMDDGSLDLSKINPVLYIGNDHYASTDGCSIRTLDRGFCIEQLGGK
jgi:flavin reductase (DIM6/NTAB) family NADH-FMN oxidoreductase RutF